MPLLALKDQYFTLHIYCKEYIVFDTSKIRLMVCSYAK